VTRFPSSRFPWANAMTIGMGLLCLPPETFWRMTLPELSAAANALLVPKRINMGRRELEEMMSRFPDSK